MRVGMIGISFKTASFAMQEKVARIATQLFKEKAFPYTTVLLSTCNRTEIYFASNSLSLTRDHLFSLLDVTFLEGIYSYFGKQCFVHLCRVCAGLDSAICMETEIARQVKAAYAQACQVGPFSKDLHHFFQKAFKVAKEIRTYFPETGERDPLFGLLWEIAKKEFPDLEEKKILLVGYSETHRKFSSFLLEKGISQITFCSASPEKVQEMSAVGRDALDSWTDYDLISCASQTDQFLIRGKGIRQHLIFDLSVPRNVDPDIEGVTLFNMEQINQIYIAEKADLVFDLYQSKFGVSRSSWERNHIADVLHASDEQDKPFEPESESCVGNRTVFSEL